MAIQTVKYFSGTQELIYSRAIPNAEFNRRFGYVLTGKRQDGYSKFVGFAAGKTLDANMLPVTRMIEYKRNPSLHKCDARCRHAKGHTCECSCGGQYHGAGG